MEETPGFGALGFGNVREGRRSMQSSMQRTCNSALAAFLESEVANNVA